MLTLLSFQVSRLQTGAGISTVLMVVKFDCDFPLYRYLFNRTKKKKRRCYFLHNLRIIHKSFITYGGPILFSRKRLQSSSV